MHEPSPRTSRLAIASGLAAAIVIGGAGYLVGRNMAQAPPSAETKAAAPAPTPSPSVAEIALPTLDRAGLLALANSAADAVTSGAPLPREVRAAAGRRFDLVLPFGCEGPSAPDRTTGLGWQYDEDARTLRVRVYPTRWSREDWSLGNGDAEQGDFEGFWVARPWSSSPNCPSAPVVGAVSDSEPLLLPGQTLAIARPLGRGAGPPLRRFETVQRLARENFDPAKGFRLRIVGRLDPEPRGDPIRCVQPGGREQRPLCLLVGDFTEIRIENPLGGEVMAAWPMNGTPSPDS